MNLGNPFIITLGAFFVLGIIFILIGRSQKLERRGWKKTTGKTVSRSEQFPRAPDFIPTFEFTAHDGNTYRVKSKVHQVPGMRGGKTVTIFYNPKNPNEAQMDTFVQNGSLFTLIGNLAISFALLFSLILLVIWTLFFS